MILKLISFIVMTITLLNCFKSFVYCLKSHQSIEKTTKNDNNHKKEWWKNAIIYQIYPRSFKDSNNDGIGDLRGIIEKLDYLKDTGITCAWLSPIFQSPQIDQRYDISDYYEIDSDYGTLEEFNELVRKAHELDIKIILDLVPNHTSDQHQWFKESVDSNNEFKDYYIWHDGVIGADGKREPPNNWISVFGDSAWTWNDKRKQFYFHQFASAQPDLNYRNLNVVQAMEDIIIFWLDFGVDGFRIDAVPHIYEAEHLQDEPKSENSISEEGTYNYLDHIYTKDQPETYDLIYKWRELVDNYVKNNGGDTSYRSNFCRVLLTESYTTFENTLRYFGNSSRLGAHFSFNFNLITSINNKSTALDVFNSIKPWLSEDIPSYVNLNWVLGNHDNHRVATRFGLERIDGYNMLLAMLEGATITYNGEEIGMEDGEVRCEEGMDPSAIKNCKTFDKVSRDFERTPFHWNDSNNAGFNNGTKTWLPISKKYKENNFGNQNQNGIMSHYNIYKASMKLKHKFDMSFATERFRVDYLPDNVIAVTRIGMDNDDNILAMFLLIFNYGNEENVITIDHIGSYTLEVAVVSSGSKRKLGDKISNFEQLNLHGYESMILVHQGQ